jgi:hypothetical protein|tara:strand:- start:502 stop:765 length:264 start_codon:yes stop_codon:yes gene_type:complete
MQCDLYSHPLPLKWFLILTKEVLIMIQFKLERIVIERVDVKGKVKEVKTPVWFLMEYDPSTGKCIFVGRNSTPYDISAEMVTAITSK